MKRSSHHRKTTVNPAHSEGALKLPHDREQLRRRLLQMILQSESQRRSTKGIARPFERAGNVAPDALVNLAVFDPDDFIGQGQASGDTPQRPA
ncbi:MAG TPA: hypothetical protein VFE46_11265 [Pirellulales bacterium]|jgi:hypothetical protein|nr:hypothetical protein [Pirellulales bacterium]